MPKPRGKTKTLIWAIDIAARDAKVRDSAVKALSAFTRKYPAHIEPVYILRVDERSFPKELLREKAPSYRLPAIEAMEAWLSKVKLPGLGKPKLLVQAGVYLRAEIDALVQHAKNARAEFILVNTHARQGFSRFWMGSFAETLMLHANFPVLFVNPRASVPSRFKTILFPTDLTETSRKILDQVLDTARDLDASVVLYNKIETYVPSPGLSWTKTPIYSKQISEEAEERRTLLEGWAVKAHRSTGVRVNVDVDESRAEVADAILAKGKKTKGCLIALVSQIGYFKSFFAGSVTRKVVRNAASPVWVLHPRES